MSGMVSWGYSGPVFYCSASPRFLFGLLRAPLPIFTSPTTALTATLAPARSPVIPFEGTNVATYILKQMMLRSRLSAQSRLQKSQNAPRATPRDPQGHHRAPRICPLRPPKGPHKRRRSNPRLLPIPTEAPTATSEATKDQQTTPTEIHDTTTGVTRRPGGMNARKRLNNINKWGR